MTQSSMVVNISSISTILLAIGDVERSVVTCPVSAGGICSQRVLSVAVGRLTEDRPSVWLTWAACFRPDKYA